MNGEYKVKLVEFGTIKALVSVTCGDFEIRGFKVVDHEGGNPWVSMPSREYQKDGERQFYDIVFFPDPEKRRAFAGRVLDAYKTALRGSSRVG
jgi:DNA-binding cell septation regulator SpoVG